MMRRRSFLKLAAALGAGGVIGTQRILAARDLVGGPALAPARYPLPVPSSHPVEHVGVVMMENRSFDHYFGWYPGADGLLDRDGALAPPRNPRRDGTEIVGENFGAGGRGLFCGADHVDPDHGWSGGREQLNGGAMDGFLTASSNDPYAISYYLEEDIPVLAALARNFTLHDRYFCSLLASTFPNREYLHSATSGGHKGNDFPGLPPSDGSDDDNDTLFPFETIVEGFPWLTIWDRLEAAGVSWAYYFNDLPVLGLWGDRFLGGALGANVRPVSSFYLDAELGTLPQVFFVDPDFVNEQNGNDDHPHADIRAGQAYLADLYHAVRTSPQWPRTAFFVTYDEWGGFYDHVVPPRVRDDRANRSNVGEDFGQLGFRVPTITVSPWSPPGQISSRTYDHASILKFIEYRFGLSPLTLRDAAAHNIGEVLDVRDPQNPPNPDPSVADVPDPDPPCRLPGVPLDGEAGPGIGLPTAYDPPSSALGGCVDGVAGGSVEGESAAARSRDVSSNPLFRLADLGRFGRFDRRDHDPLDSYR